MGLFTAMQIGRSALVSSQVGIQVAGNNMANAATPGYTRQSLFLSPSRGQVMGSYSLGRGVGIDAVERQIDEALQARLRAGISDESSASTLSDIMSQLESVMGELSDNDLSTELGTFFGTWSEATNLISSQSVVVQQADQLAQFVRGMRSDMSLIRTQIESQIDTRVQRADTLFSQVATLNDQIAAAETGGATANELRDKRDSALEELASLMDISAVEQANGSVDVLVGSIPIVQGSTSRGVQVARESDGSTQTTVVTLGTDGSPLPVSSGSIGGLLEARDGNIDATIDRLDTLTSRLIFEVNKLHSTGTNLAGLRSTIGELSIATDDQDRPLNSVLNTTLAGLPFEPNNGGFFVDVRNPATGASKRVRIDVDLDGITDDGATGTGDDTSAQDIVDALDAIQGIGASINAAGQIEISADTGFEFSFSNDSSGALAALGINTLFTGTNASDIAVRQSLMDDPTGLMVGRFENGELVENGTALGISALRDNAIDALGGISIAKHWSDSVQLVASKSSIARTNADAGSIVRESLESQRASVSGVSVDEESINLLNYQRQFQGAAKVISTADQLLQTLIAIL
ncbi:MAG: flagellar hook-associated protein FlgK [Phycisphaeraceae bacterium]|nr:MAG: flagellar hook-associated protein FlgK [Phycisphaeraceae bacterium]